MGKLSFLPLVFVFFSPSDWITAGRKARVDKAVTMSTEAEQLAAASAGNWIFTHQMDRGAAR